MYHFFEAVTNSKGASLPGYFGRLIDPTTGAVVSIYADAASTPIITTSGVVNMAKTDSVGNLSLYVAPGTYHVDIYGSDAQTFVYRVSNVPMTATQGQQGLQGPTGTSNNTYSDLPTFKASDIARATAQLAGVAGVPDGIFTFQTTGAPYTADDLNVIKADSTALSVGAWVRQAAQGVASKRSDSGAKLRTVQAELSDIISAKSFGAIGDGTTDDAPAINAALTAGAGGKVFLPRTAASYLCRSQIVVPDFTALVLDGWGCVLKKGFNGDLVSLGKQAFIDHGVIDGNKANYTGNGVTISVGANTPTVALQGHQRVSRVFFQNVAGYPVIYPTANQGWMSVVEKCAFQGTGGVAAVCWPDEPASGGNRKVLDSYSDVPIVNLNGCDNGIITGNTVGSSGSTNQAIYCPAGTTNRAKKVIIANNRFAIGGGTINFRGFDCQFDHNIIAGNVSFENNAANDGATTSFFGSSNILTGSFTDSSGSPNNIQLSAQTSFTPTITASGGGFAMGNADVRAEYTRSGPIIRAKYAITFGSTTTFGSGYYTVSLPVNRYAALTTDFCGSALAQNQSCCAQTLFGSGTDGFYVLTSGGSPVGASVPSAWASGNKLFVSIEYRIY